MTRNRYRIVRSPAGGFSPQVMVPKTGTWVEFSISFKTRGQAEKACFIHSNPEPYDYDPYAKAEEKKGGGKWKRFCRWFSSVTSSGG